MPAAGFRFTYQSLMTDIRLGHSSLHSTADLVTAGTFTAFAPVSGVISPSDLRNAKDRRIYWVHGAFDWMFPVERARQDYTILKTAGADITLRVIDDLSHAYFREQNDRILIWFDSSLALPTPDDRK